MSDLLKAPERLKRPDFLNMCARELYGLPDEWAWFSTELIGAHDSPHRAYLLQGVVCTATISRGPRKGRKNWRARDRATECKVVVTDAQLTAFCERWEATTGRCHVCAGGGQQAVGWNRETGTRYRTCTRCDGTGRAPTTASAAA